MDYIFSFRNVTACSLGNDGGKRSMMCANKCIYKGHLSESSLLDCNLRAVE
jgi:hypothetical protein